MEICRKMRVSAEEFFATLLESVKYDIENSTGDKNIVLVEGFTYKKQLSNKLGIKGEVLVKIESLRVPCEYVASFSEERGVNFIKYKINALDVNEENINITYTEEYIPNGFLNKINHNIMSVLFKRKSNKKIKKLFDSMEQYFENRELEKVET